MCIFFERKQKNNKYELLSYVGYFLVINYMYLIISIPIFTVLSNIITFFLLTFNYKAPMIRRIISAIYMYVILMTVEVIIVIISGYTDLSLFNVDSQYGSIAGLISIKIFSYIVVLIIQNYKNIKKGINVPNSYWLSLFVIPVGTLYIMFLFFENNKLSSYKIIISISILFIINIVSFYLYDVLNSVYKDKIEKALVMQQNDYYHRQIEIIDTSYRNINSIRHDIKNHLIIIKSYINLNDKEKALIYIQEIMNATYTEKEIVKTGNFDIDSILNYKLQNAKINQIDVTVEAKIPEQLNIDSIDIAVIMGNLLDNAIEAVSKLENNRSIKLRMEYKKNALYIHINNTYNGTVLYEGNKICTSQIDRLHHGIGLNNIENVISKYNGTMEIHHTGNNFIVDILIYVE